MTTRPDPNSIDVNTGQPIKKKMISRSAKALYYAIAGPLLKLNGVLYKNLKAPRAGVHKVHLGPGKRKYIPGWINVDANRFTAKCDVWADLRNPLPFNTGSIDAAYSHHVIEHLPHLKAHFEEVLRCLKLGGVYRVGGPNGDSAIKKFVENDAKWFRDFPDNRTSIGGRFENFIFCRQEHLTILTYSFLEELMTDVGFTNIRLCCPMTETNYPDIFNVCLANEEENDFEVPHTLLIEAVKPG